MRRKPVFLAIIALIMLSLLVTTVPKVSGVQDIPQVQLSEGVERGWLTYEARGKGYASGAMIDLTITSLTTEPFTVVIPEGARFVPVSPTETNYRSNDADVRFKRDPALQGGAQGAVATGGGFSTGASGGVESYHPAPMNVHFNQGLSRNEGGIVLAAHRNETRYFTIEAFCTDAHLANPSTSDTFIVLPPEDDQLTQLIAAYNNYPERDRMSVVAIQVAMWIITDDIDLELLTDLGYEPTNTDLYHAFTLLQLADIDISDKKLGQMPIPTPDPIPPVFNPGEPTVVEARGVVTEDGAPLVGAQVSFNINRPGRYLSVRVFTSQDGHFETQLDIFETDTITVVLEDDGQEIGQLEYSAIEFYEAFDNGGELLLEVTTQPSGDTGGGPYEVTIHNNTLCTLSGNLGPVPYTVESGQSVTITVPAGTHTMDGSGDCGVLQPQTYQIDGPGLSITLGG